MPAEGGKSTEASRYDRASQYDAAADKCIHWDANRDGSGTISEDATSVTMAEMTGPGVIDRIWSPAPDSGEKLRKRAAQPRREKRRRRAGDAVRLDTLHLDAGPHTLGVTILGKNPASESYPFGFNCLRLEPVPASAKSGNNKVD